MTTSKTFFLTVVSVLLCSAVLLSGCIYATFDAESSRPYGEESLSIDGNQTESSEPAEPDDEGLIVSQYNQYFRKFIHLTDDKETAVLYTEEEFTELMQKRGSDEGEELSYTALLYLINDSVDLYFRYDKIVLTNAIADRISHRYDQYPDGEKDEVILPKEWGFLNTETSEDKLELYEQIIEDIYSIIHYRIYLHDKRAMMVRANSRYMHCLPLSGYAEPELPPEGSIQLPIIIDDPHEPPYEQKIEMQRLGRPFLFSYVRTEDEVRLPSTITSWAGYLAKPYHIYLMNESGNEGAPFVQLFPTPELAEREPSDLMRYTTDAGMFGPRLNLNLRDNTFTVSPNVYSSYFGVGKYEQTPERLTLYLEEQSGDRVETYLYVFDCKDDALYYRQDLSKPTKRNDLNFPVGLEFFPSDG